MPHMSRQTARAWLHALLLCTAVFVYAVFLQGVRPLYSPDEGRYTNVALVMLDTGDWLRPMLHHEVEHWSKPPLTYWSIASSFAVFGHYEFSARLPGALAFGATILLMLRLGRRFVPTQPWLPALVYASFLFPSLASNLVTTDSLLALWETLQVVAFTELWWSTKPTAARRARWLLGVAAGLAFMTKGPPGLLALAGCLAFTLWSDGWRGLRRAVSWDALLLFPVVGCSWYAWILLRRPEVMHYFLMEEVVNRIATDKMRRNAEWYGALKVYAPTLLVGSLPWLPVLCAALWQSRGTMLQRLRDDEETRLLACWLLLPLMAFMIARSRLPLYLLPIFAPLALLTARRLVRVRPVPRWVVPVVALWCLALAMTRAAPAFFDIAQDDRRLAEEISKQLDTIPNEIVFVATNARYGLRFYLGSHIERVYLPSDPTQPQSQDLASELEEREGCRLMAAQADRVDELEGHLERHGVAFRRLSNAGGYTLVAELSSDCDWSGTSTASKSG